MIANKLCQDPCAYTARNTTLSYGTNLTGVFCIPRAKLNADSKCCSVSHDKKDFDCKVEAKKYDYGKGQVPHCAWGYENSEESVLKPKDWHEWYHQIY